MMASTLVRGAALTGLAAPKPSPPVGLAGRGRAAHVPLRFQPQGLRLPACHVSARDEQQQQQHKKDEAYKPGNASEDSELLFTEPLLRGLVLGVGAGVLCEVLHVALKVTDIAGGAGWNLPSAADMYESLRPVFLVDHVAAFSFWLLFYLIEAAAILTILRQYPDDTKEATKVIKNTSTLPKVLMPLKLSAARRAIHAFVHGRQAQAAAQQLGASAGKPMAFRDDSSGPAVLPGPRPSGMGGAGVAVLERPRPTQEPPNKAPEDSERAPPKAKPVKPLPGRASGEATTQAPRTASGLRPGQLDPSSPLLMPRTANLPKDQASKRAKELHDRKAYLKNFWYAAAISDKVSAKPIKVEMLSRTVTIWRDEESGQVHCLDNVCPHRGAPLSGGWSKKSASGKSCVVCPYHGWAFDGEGRLQEVPSQDASTAFPRRPVVDSYPVEERGGFVWLFFGSKTMPADERPPIPICKELEDPQWRAVYGELEFDSPHHNVFENAMDFAHIHYLHDGSFGNQDNPVIHDMKVERDTWHVTASFNIHNKPVSPLWQWTAVPQVPVEARAYLPSTSYVKITLGNGVEMITFVNTVPIDDKRSINRFCLIRNFALWPAFDSYARKNMFKILGEDKVMLEQLRPEQIKTELSLEADKPQVAFRKLRQEWIDMGYAAPPESVTSHNGSLSADL